MYFKERVSRCFTEYTQSFTVFSLFSRVNYIFKKTKIVRWLARSWAGCREGKHIVIFSCHEDSKTLSGTKKYLCFFVPSSLSGEISSNVVTNVQHGDFAIANRATLCNLKANVPFYSKSY